MAIPRWLLLSLLQLMEGDTASCWALVNAIGYDVPFEDDAVWYFLIV